MGLCAKFTQEQSHDLTSGSHLANFDWTVACGIVRPLRVAEDVVVAVVSDER